MDQLKEFYYNPRTGFISAEKMYLKLNKKVPLTTIKKFISNQETYQIMKSSRNRKLYRPINVYSINNLWQIDLIDFSKFSKWNSGYKYLMCVIDVFSRKAFVSALKSKSDTTNAMQDILVQESPILIQSDNGTEFLNSKFQKLLSEKIVRHITVPVNDHNRQGIVERFNRTFEGLVSNYQQSRNNNRYIDILDDLVYNYNNSFHRSIKTTPQIMHDENPSKGMKLVNNVDSNLKIGDKVRLLIEKKIFDKGYKPNYSQSIYTIISGNGYTFQIATDKGLVIKSKYKYFHLQKVNSLDRYPVINEIRETPMTRKEKTNKREISALEEFTFQPLFKKRKHFK